MQTRVSQKLGQRLALTPQLTQSLKVLAMNALELDAYIEETLESNPLLEQEEVSAQPSATTAEEKSGDEEAWREEGDDRWETMYTSSSRDAVPDSREQQWEDEQSLNDSLHEQIDRQPMEDTDRAIAHALIDSLDDDGYFRSAPSDMADELGVKPAQVIHALECVVQELEPAGIGARNLVECLLLQLDDDDDSATLVRTALLHFSESLFEADETLAEMLECSLEEMAQVRARMRRLDPFPGHGLRGETNIYVRPEIIFRRNNQKAIEVEVPTAGWGNLHMNHQWEGHKWRGKEREFMENATQEAKWLLHALDQRRDTLMKVGRCLARRQRAFLEHGILGLKPLTLQDVADEVELHESTISRVTNGKYAETPLGLIEMRCFFSAGLPTRGGGSISVYRVQQRVKTLIESEPPGKPISDQAIADRLQAEGIEIARRTVAKYREQLRLPTSSQRRRAAAHLPQQRR